MSIGEWFSEADYMLLAEELRVFPATNLEKGQAIALVELAKLKKEVRELRADWADNLR